MTKHSDRYLTQEGMHYILCDRCSRKIRERDAKLTWDGFLVCEKDWEPRHPQEQIYKARTERALAPNRIRPEGEDEFGTGNTDDL